MSLKELETEAMKLGIEDRAALAEKFLLSVDAPSDTENLTLWVAEAERRLKELRDGTAEGVPVDEVFRRARAAIPC
ncbi:addiction module protein [candidate division KSB1 bacterium]|nr:addiction module protein [candidate division KSB1 bacterium]MBL7095460.1 addiction module protein [candidate division KSB1 bacterium]